MKTPRAFPFRAAHRPTPRLPRLSICGAVLGSALLLGLAASTSVAAADLRFERVASPALDGITRQAYGGAWGDANRDGLPDLYLPTLFGAPAAYFEGSATGLKPSLTPDIGLGEASRAGAVWADVDNDGDLDLFVATTAEEDDQLYLQDAGRFTAVTRPPFAGSRAMGQTCAAADYNNDGFVDFFVPNGGGWYPQANFLFRNLGAGGFDLDSASPVMTEVLQSHGGAFADFDNDGWMDLLVLNIGAPNSLFKNSRAGTFEAPAANPFLNPTLPQGGNSLAWGDYDNDGDLDLFITHGRPNHFLFRNDGSSQFTQITDAAPALAGGDAIGCAWADFDNDGWLDLIAANRTGSTLLFRGSKTGEFTPVDQDPLGSQSWGANGLAIADYDRDGDLDVLLSNWTGGPPPALFRNTTTGNRYLRVRLTSTRSNRDGLGAKVRIRSVLQGESRSQLRQIGGEDALGSQEAIAHFGLGDARIVDHIRIEWPSGSIQELTAVAADQTLLVEEPAGFTPAPPITFSRVDDPTLNAVARANFAAAWGDADGDGRPDLYLAGLDPGPGQLLRNTPSGFSAVTEGPVITDQGQRAGAAWGDLDNDGDLDLFVVKAYGETDLLYRNDGTNGFVPLSGPPTTTPTLGISGLGFDYDADGRLDLLATTGGGSGAEPNRLYRNLPSGDFAAVTPHPITDEVRFSHGAAFADFTGDNRPDLFVANSYGPPSAFRNLGGGAFESILGTPAGPDFLPDGSTIPVFADFDNDGDFDLLLPTGSSFNFYYRNDAGQRLVRDVLMPITLTGGPVAGALAEDFNNDGWIDVLTASRDGAHRLYEGIGSGKFRERPENLITAGAAAANGLAAADYDLDGDVDVLLATWPGPAAPALFRNDSGSNHWLRIRLVGTRSNRDGIGTVVRTTSADSRNPGTTLRQLRQVGGFDSSGSHEYIAHFGLGTATTADVELLWPSGRRQFLTGVHANQVLTVREAEFDSSQPETFGPPVLNRQTGLFELRVPFTALPYPTGNTFRISITNLPAGVRWNEANGTNSVGPFVTLPVSPETGIPLPLVFSFHSPGRQPLPALTLIATITPISTPAPPAGPVIVVERTVPLANGSVLVEFLSTPGTRYAIQYSTDLVQWLTTPATLVAGGTRTQWIDAGPPATSSLPGTNSTRFYRVIALPNP